MISNRNAYPTLKTKASALAIFMPLLAGAADVDTSEWRCEFCPFENGELARSVEAGALYVDESAAKFGEYDGLDKTGGYLVLNGNVGKRMEDGNFWRIDAQDLGLASRAAALSRGREGAWQFDLGYVASPHNVFDTTVTPLQSPAPGSLTLPTGWVRAGNTQNMTALGASLHGYDLNTTRERWSVSAAVNPASRWQTHLHYTHETRDGHLLRGSNFILTASQLPAAIDYVTDQLEWSVRYGGERGAVMLSYLGSFFTDRQPDFSWSNPFTAIAPGADQGRAAVAPSNSYNQVAVNASYRLRTGWNARLNGSLGKAKQDEFFLPYTSNTLISTTPLPRASLDGQVAVRHLDLQLNGDLGADVPILKGLRTKLSYRFHDRDNATPQSDYRYVESDTFLAGVATNLPYGYTRENLALSGEYDVGRLLHLDSGRRARLSSGWEREHWQRTFQEVNNSTEDRGWLRMQVRPAQWLAFDARYGTANRHVEAYVANPQGSTAQYPAPQNPLLRKYNLADRERDYWNAGAQLSLPGNVDLSLDGFRRRDDYINSVVGLTDSRDVGGTADLSWTVVERLATFAFYGRQEITSRQNGSQSFGATDWQARNRDQFDSASLGLRYRTESERMNIQFDYFVVNSRGDIDVLLGTSTLALPSLRTRSYGPRLKIVFLATPALEIIGNLRYEHFNSDDWALDGTEPNTLPSILASGANAYDYDVNVVGVALRYRFGGADNASAATTAKEE